MTCSDLFNSVNGDPSLVTQPFEGPEVENFKAAIETGETQIVADRADGSTRLYFPFTTYGMNKTWVVVLDVPRHVFADEPTSALDANSQAAFLDLMFERVTAQDAALLMVSHDERLADRFDRVVHMSDITSNRGVST